MECEPWPVRKLTGSNGGMLVCWNPWNSRSKDSEDSGGGEGKRAKTGLSVSPGPSTNFTRIHRTSPEFPGMPKDS